MESFAEVYDRRHRLIESDTEYMIQLYEEYAFLDIVFASRAPIGPTKDGVFLSMDTYLYESFETILAKMAIVHHVSKGQADLPFAFARLTHPPTTVILEDITKDRQHTAVDQLEYPYEVDQRLEVIFENDRSWFMRATSMVFSRPDYMALKKEERDKIEPIRLPIMDFGCLTVQSEYIDEFEAYCQEFKDDERFILKCP
ncbi:hypothetical protein CL622_09000 [archaeon]|nr:hypothetical protein [archaeon]|tara:strand:+ start:217 stop:813 length:597 start_codon:yes stop_codon:yes gene_type:complete